MARAYTVATVALALETPTKWVDNALSHHTLTGIAQDRQGVLRRVSLEGVQQLAVGLLLIHELNIPAATAFRVAAILNDKEGHYRTPGGLAIQLDLGRLRADLESRLARAVEIAPVPRRGRPPSPSSSSKTGRLD